MQRTVNPARYMKPFAAETQYTTHPWYSAEGQECPVEHRSSVDYKTVLPRCSKVPELSFIKNLIMT